MATLDRQVFFSVQKKSIRDLQSVPEKTKDVNYTATVLVDPPGRTQFAAKLLLAHLRDVEFLC